MKNLFINTDRLYITKYNLDMADSVSKISLDTDNRRFMPDEVFETANEAAKTLKFLIECYEGAEGPFVYPVYLKNGTHIGHVEAVSIGNEKWEIGYHINCAFSGHGYATEAVTAFLPCVLNALKANKIYGICVSENVASKRVLDKCGFKKEYEGEGLYQGQMRKIYRAVYVLAYHKLT